MAIFLGCFGLLLVGAGFWLYGKHRSVAAWPTIPGKILEKSIGLTKQAAAGGPRARFEVFVKYEYRVADQDYVGDRLTNVHSLLDEESAKQACDALAVEPMVYYNPADPADSYLGLQSPWFHRSFFIIGFLLMSVGVLLMRTS